MTPVLSIDLTSPVAEAAAAPYGPGTSRDPQGRELRADQRSLSLDGVPWIPVVGEFQFSRYPREEWCDAMLAMRAGGVDTLSTYVFWNHHEEVRGTFDWTGSRSLRAFVELAQHTGLKVIVRMGPWCHGEARNGGFPDWVQDSGTELRELDESFLALVRPFFAEQARQLEGLLWKDGGPVIGVQLDNESDDADNLLACKDLARGVGVDVPLYTVTGWQGGLPEAGLIPLFGGYADGFWTDDKEQFGKEFLFSTVRVMNDLGAQLETISEVNTRVIDRFPYLCAEIGGGMMSAYDRRIRTDPHDLAALALTKLGNGNNAPGYYLYHGGIHPTGALSFLHEDQPNRMPVKDYDFGAPLSMTGLPREHYGLFRQQHLLLRWLGPSLARMTVFLPDLLPRDLADVDSLRWSVRADSASGFVFLGNREPSGRLPEHRDVQLRMTTGRGVVTVPRSPITIPPGAYGVWPLRLDCDQVLLDYATVQPLHRIVDEDGTPVHLFVALEGVRPELCIAGEVIGVTTLGTTEVVTRSDPAGHLVRFVVLTPDQGRQLGVVRLAGRERVILTDAVVLADGEQLRLRSPATQASSFAIFPRVASVLVDQTQLDEVPDGVFSRFFPQVSPPPVPEVTLSTVQPAGPRATTFAGTDDSTWADAAVYRVKVPPADTGRRWQLDVHYTGDAARLYAGRELVMDDYYNGDPMSVGLWRLSSEQLGDLRLEVLPYSDHLTNRLPNAALQSVGQARAAGTLDVVRVTVSEHLELTVVAGPPSPHREEHDAR